MEENKNLTTTSSGLPTEYDPNVAYGFEESRPEDVLIPRLKVINALSPERQDGTAEEGAVINSLTGESVVGKRFIPIKQYYSNIEWNPDRSAEERIFCRSFDGRIGEGVHGTLACAQCRRNQFDNSKKGKEAQPLCTSYINFLGFMEGNPMPVVLSFARTNFNEGKKLLSIARSMRTSIWNYAYVVKSVLVSKDRNKWYNLQVAMAGETTADERALAFELFKAYEHAQVKADYEEGGAVTSEEPDAEIASEI